MHRMTQKNNKSLFVATVAIALASAIGMTPATAAPPRVVQANMDYEASGFVTPAGMVAPSMYQGGVRPVGYFGGCDSCGSTACDGMGGCDSGGIYGGCDSCGSNCGGGCGVLTGGLLGSMHSGCDQCGGGGCSACSGLSGLRRFCMFCQGGGCSACQMCNPANLLGLCHALKPYTEAGICSQRWYDLSTETTFLSHSDGSLSSGVTSLGPSGPIVLGLGASESGDDLEAGMRLSASFIFGVGGNIEGTYMGNNRWSSSGSVSDPGAGLFSFISDFGTNPAGGFDDTDRSLVQSVSVSSEFHSGELNYRRRTMGPYCRFQGSWLVGLRYLRFQNGLLYATQGENNNTVNANLPRFFSSDDDIKNNLFGPQAGFDLWWNMQPGINLGIGFKGAWVQNDMDRRSVFTGNSLAAGGPGVVALTDKEQDTTVMGEFQAKLIYRLTHSWSFRTAYYAIAVDDIAFASVDGQTVNDFVTLSTPTEPRYDVNSLTVQGFSFGTEYIW